jgi:flagellin-like protein
MAARIGRRGISPLIAAVILIAFVIAIANLAGPWIQEFITGKTSEVEEKSDRSVECIYAQIDYDTEDVDFADNLTSNLVNITLDNSGSEPLYNLTVNYVIDSRGFNGEVIRNQPTQDSPLESGSRVILVTEVQNSSSLAGKVLQKVRISTRVCPNLERTCNIVEDDCS